MYMLDVQPLVLREARLHAAGEFSFDNDPGWPGIEQECALQRIDRTLHRQWLKEKREGTFVNKVLVEARPKLAPIAMFFSEQDRPF